MRFKLETATNLIHDTNKEKLERYKKLGFEFKAPYDATPEMYNGVLHNIDNDNLTVGINTLEELMEFINTHGRIVVEKDTITIYDDWLE